MKSTGLHLPASGYRGRNPPSRRLGRGGKDPRLLFPLDRVPPDREVHDFGDAAILPGLVDSHLHINDPGRTEWEGFETATRAAAAGGYTLAGGHASELSSGDDDGRRTRSKACGGAWQVPGRLGGMGWRGQRQSGGYRSARGRRRAGASNAFSFIPESTVSPWSPSRSCERPCLTWRERGLPLLVHAELAGPVDAATKRLGQCGLESLRHVLAIAA